jgi:hypothetical protein
MIAWQLSNPNSVRKEIALLGIHPEYFKLKL